MSPVTINWPLATWMALTMESPVSFWKRLFHFNGSTVSSPFSLGDCPQTPQEAMPTRYPSPPSSPGMLGAPMEGSSSKVGWGVTEQGGLDVRV